MHNILQRHWFTTVRQIEQLQMLDAHTHYHGSEGELAVHLQTTMDELKITQASWEKCSYPADLKHIDTLIGVIAYLNSGANLKQALKNLDRLPQTLFAETVRGIIQAETYIWQQRGFPSAADYSLHWEKIYLGSCCYYSNLDRVQQKWDDYAFNHRPLTLFNRFKCQQVYQDQKHDYHVYGQLSDSFHEVSVILQLNQQLVIKKASAQLIRVPDQVCREALTYLPQLVGQNMNGCSKKQIAHLLGKGHGCVHLIDTVYDGVESILQITTKGGAAT